MSGEYDDEKVLECGHSHPCAMRCEECRKRSCPDCVHIWDNIMTCARCAPSVVEFLIKQAGHISHLNLTNEAAVRDLQQTIEHAGSLGTWAMERLMRQRAVRLVTRPTMQDALAAMRGQA